MLFFTVMPFGYASSRLSNPTKDASLPYGGDNHGQALLPLHRLTKLVRLELKFYLSSYQLECFL